VRLFDRNTRSVALTQTGKEFLPVVERVLGEIDAVALNARNLAEGQRGLVTVAALPAMASTLLPATIAAFKTEHPGITVRLRDGVMQRVLTLVKSGEVDFGVATTTRRDPEITISPLMADPVSVVFPAGHPLERQRRITLDGLLKVPLIVMNPEYSVRTLVDRILESSGKSVEPAFEASYVPTAIGLVKAGLGVAIIALSAAREPAQLAGLRVRAISHPALARHIGIIQRAGSSLSPAAERFLKAVRAACRRQAA